MGEVVEIGARRTGKTASMLSAVGIIDPVTGDLLAHAFTAPLDGVQGFCLCGLPRPNPIHLEAA